MSLPTIGSVRTGCLCCPPKPEVAPLDWQPHPGFGRLYLKCDGVESREFDDFCWTALSRDENGIDWQGEHLTIGDIEDAVAEDPDHDWRLEVHGPMGGVVYQRQGCAQWVAVERLEGFA